MSTSASVTSAGCLSSTIRIPMNANKRVRNDCLQITMDGRLTGNVIDISRSQCARILMTACKSHCHHRKQKYLYSRLDFFGITLVLNGERRLCSIVRLSPSDVQLLNSVRTKFICKNFHFYSIQRILLGSVRLYAQAHNRISMGCAIVALAAGAHNHLHEFVRNTKRSSIYKKKHVVHICMTLCVVALLVTSLF